MATYQTLCGRCLDIGIERPVAGHGSLPEGSNRILNHHSLHLNPKSPEAHDCCERTTGSCAKDMLWLRHQGPLFALSAARLARADLTRGARLMSGSALEMN